MVPGQVLPACACVRYKKGRAACSGDSRKARGEFFLPQVLLIASSQTGVEEREEAVKAEDTSAAAGRFTDSEMPCIKYNTCRPALRGVSPPPPPPPPHRRFPSPIVCLLNPAAGLPWVPSVCLSWAPATSMLCMLICDKTHAHERACTHMHMHMHALYNGTMF